VIHSVEPLTDLRVDLLVPGSREGDHDVPWGAMTRRNPDMPDLKKGARITGPQRDKLATDLKKKYEKGASIRALAEQTGRSYGFVHRVLSETGVTLRGRGGATRTKKK
jgi:hypothetical protein